MLALKVLIPLQAAGILGIVSIWLLSTVTKGKEHPPANSKVDVLSTCLTQLAVPFVTSHDANHTIWIESTTPYNTRIKYTPRAVVIPKSTTHVQNAVRCAARHDVRVTPKSGGHSFVSSGLGGEDGHLVVDLSGMENVTLLLDNVTAIIQPGARLGHVATQLYNQGKRALSHGSCPG